jgi:hypothetical protein
VRVIATHWSLELLLLHLTLTAVVVLRLTCFTNYE